MHKEQKSENSRTKNSLNNSLVAIISQGIVLLAQFVIQAVFAKTLGAEYLGANGLFSNVLSFLSFAELGIGVSITYSLYKPLTNHDNNRILELMNFFKKAYQIIGTSIFLIGTVLSFFIPMIVNKNSSIPNVQLMFMLYLCNSAVSYFFTYKRTLLIANQQAYIDSLNKLIFISMQTVVQVIFLTMTHKYISYLLIQIVFTILSNWQISKKADKQFGILKIKKKTRLDKKTKKIIGKNVLGAISSKLGGIVANGTDNLIISKFIGLSMVGYYSNYMLLLNGLQSVTNQIFNSVVASLANFTYSNKRSDEEKIFYLYMYMVSCITFVLSTTVYFVVNSFIYVWLGEKYVLPNVTIFLLVCNWSISMLRNTVLSFAAVHGLYWEFRWKAVVESIVNLAVGLTLITLFNWGINSVIIGTLSANVLVNLWWEPLVVLKKGIRGSIHRYFAHYFSYLFFNLAILLIMFFFINNGLFFADNLFKFILTGFAVFLAMCLLFLVATSRTAAFKFYYRIAFDFLKKMT